MSAILGYVTFSALWIIWSDRLLFSLFPDAERLTHLQTIKGFIYIVLSTAVLYFLFKLEDRKKAHSAHLIEETATRFCRVFQASPAAIIITNLQSGRLIDVNDSFSKMLGYSRAELIGRTTLEIGIWRDTSDRELFVQRLVAGESVRELRTEFRTKSGVLRYGVAAAELIELEGERCIVTLIQDITERHEAEQALAQNEERQRLMLEHVKDYAISMLDTQGCVVSWNKGGERIFGCHVEEMLGEHFSCFYPDEEVAAGRVERALQYAATKGRWEEEGWLVRKDATRIWANTVLTALYDEAGALRGFSDVTRDVTDRQRNQEALRDSEARLRSVVESLGEGLLLTDLEDRVLYSNTRLSAMTGYPADEIFGRPAAEILLLPDDYAGLGARTSVLEEGCAELFELQVRRKDDASFWAENHATPLRNAEGEVVGTLSALSDISERKNVEHNLAQSEKRFRSTFQQAAVGIAHVGLDGRWLMVNQRLCEIVGYSHDELLQMHFNDLTLPGQTAEGDVRLNTAYSERLLRGEIDTYRLEKRCLRKDGGIAWINLTVSLVHNDAQEAHYFIYVIEDISQRKGLEEALRDTNQSLLALFRAAPLAICTSDHEGKVTLWNPAAERIFGWAENEIFGCTLPIVPDEAREAAQTMHARVLAGESFTETEAVGLKHNGERCHISVSSAPLYDREGRVSSILTMISDISARRQAEAQVLQLNRELETRLRRISALRQIDLAITSSFDLRVTLDIFLTQVSSQLGVDAVAISEYNPHSQTLEFSAGRGLRSRNSQRSGLRLGEGHAGRAILERRTLSASVENPGDKRIFAEPALAAEG
ncbi:MAG TPA: PAS domain S-box protein, partial [Abditibacteriaceae bacterium]